MENYKNQDRACECWKCKQRQECAYNEKYQRLPPDIAPGALGLCPKLQNASTSSK